MSSPKITRMLGFCWGWACAKSEKPSSGVRNRLAAIATIRAARLRMLEPTERVLIACLLLPTQQFRLHRPHVASKSHVRRLLSLVTDIGRRGDVWSGPLL